MNKRIADHREFARTPRHRTPSFRIEQLDRLAAAIAEHRESIVSALAADLGKPEMEAYASEIGPVMREIAFARRRIRRWMRPVRAGRGRRILAAPYGAALIIGTWNYPFQLTLSPLVAAIAAGNGVTVKPSEVAPESAAAIDRMLSGTFEPAAVSVVQGDADVSAELVDSGYDKVFFTGSPRVGAVVATAAAAHHSDVTLELGGKSPVIVGPGAGLAYAANRIAWGKSINAGQTCMAPDYLLVPEEHVDEMVRLLLTAFESFFGGDPRVSPDYGRIVNLYHFDRLSALLDREGLSLRTNRAERFIPPAAFRATVDSAFMEEEIFGPILPVLAYRTFEELESIVARNPNPLASYVFTRDRAFERSVLDRIPSGGAMANDVVLHAVDPRIPFGGVGSSGTGSYHGRFGFETFSHLKGAVRVRQGRSGSMRFPPYRTLPPLIRKWLFGV